ncbi:hypothetical protein LOK49_LG09G00036 [Camellia lanceoleosa]|uniref:Uncharacterized protein n=1 Tax=Camellia lanceoleosa TaxID=1840588 RepID=A0ACC0GMY4_9ERIC|nr:hypothetical protein LOK49_LG09G00036 [Camellia lanceoleosa]
MEAKWCSLPDSYPLRIHGNGSITSTKRSLGSDLPFASLAVLVSRYKGGNDYVGWHADDEKLMVQLLKLPQFPLVVIVEFLLKKKPSKNVPKVLYDDGDVEVLCLDKELGAY